jgi:hypothetical protein
MESAIFAVSWRASCAIRVAGGRGKSAPIAPWRGCFSIAENKGGPGSNAGVTDQLRADGGGFRFVGNAVLQRSPNFTPKTHLAD